MTQNCGWPFWVKILPCVLFLYGPLFQMTSLCTTMKRTASQAFEDPVPRTLMPVLELKLHVALSPIQFQSLLDRRPTLPDPYSGRFGLRSDPLKAIERAHYFIHWSAPYAESPPSTQIKKFMLCTLSFTPIGTWRRH